MRNEKREDRYVSREDTRQASTYLVVFEQCKGRLNQIRETRFDGSVETMTTASYETRVAPRIFVRHMLDAVMGLVSDLSIRKHPVSFPYLSPLVRTVDPPSPCRSASAAPPSALSVSLEMLVLGLLPRALRDRWSRRQWRGFRRGESSAQRRGRGGFGVCEWG